MTERASSPAYAVLSNSARRVFRAIEAAIGDGTSAAVSYTSFQLDYHVDRTAISSSLKLLDHLGLIDIEPGPRLVNVFRLSNRWRAVDADEAARLAALAREVKPGRRTFSKPPMPKPVTAKPVKVRSEKRARRRRAVQRQVPSLARLAWNDADGR